MWKARVVGKQHEEKRFTSNFYVRNMYFGTPRFCCIKPFASGNEERNRFDKQCKNKLCSIKLATRAAMIKWL